MKEILLSCMVTMPINTSNFEDYSNLLFADRHEYCKGYMMNEDESTPELALGTYAACMSDMYELIHQDMYLAHKDKYKGS